jgi:aspartate carbamoyltransferase catalytic subunit
MSILYQHDILSVQQFDRKNIDLICNHAEFLRNQERTILLEHLKGYTIANLFYEPSTRTSSSFYSAMTKLGGGVIPINEVTYSSVVKGETLEDTIRTLECYSDLIVLRHGEVGAAQRAADITYIPIINAGDGTGQHPTQSLLDIYTIFKEHKRIDGLTITLMGDLKHGRTVHSLADILRLYDVRLNLISPNELQMPDEHKIGININHQGDNLNDVIRDTDVLYVTRVQKERFAPAVVVDYQYGVTLDHMRVAKDNMILMHPLPRVGEIPTEIDLDPRAAYFRQMKNGLYIRMALLNLILQHPKTACSLDARIKGS